MPISPTVEGFRAAFRRPSVSFAEIAWRWSVGVVAGTVALFGLIEYFDTIPVSWQDSLLLRSGQPYLIAAAVGHILRGSLARGIFSAAIAALLLTGIWIVAASIGRYATVRDLLHYFSLRRQSLGVIAEDRQNTSAIATSRDEPRRALSALLRLNFLRAANVLAGVLGWVGVTIFAGAISGHYSQPALGTLLFFPGATFVVAIVWMLNWFVILAAMIAVRDDEGAVAALSSAAKLCRSGAGAVAAVTVWTALIHLAAFSFVASFAMTPVLFLQVLPWRVVALAVLLIWLAYFAFTDWLAIGRLAGYLSITELPRETFVSTPPIVPRSPEPAPSSAVDPNELILSDVPFSQPI